MTLIKLRKKPAAKNTVRLYLDAYPPIYDPLTGKSQRKFYLKLFLYRMPKSKLEKKHNDQTLFLAENLRVKMMLAVYNNRISNKLRMSILSGNY